MSAFSVYPDWADEPRRRSDRPDHHAHCKKCVWLPEEMLAEMWAEARRLDRPVSWVVQTAWRVARSAILAQPSSVQGLREAIARAERGS